MKWWYISFLLLPVASQWKKNNGRVHGLYYMPSMIGVNPLATFDGPTLYGDYFSPIYNRDLEIMSQISNLILLPGAGGQKIDENFLDSCHEHGISVAITFEFRAYDLVDRWTTAERKHVETDLTNLVEKVEKWNHPAVAMWVFGDLYDPVFGKKGSTQSTEFIDQYLPFVKTMKRVVQKVSSLPFAVSLFVGNDRGVRFIEEIDSHLRDPNDKKKAPFDYWIFVMEESQEATPDGLLDIEHRLKKLSKEAPGNVNPSIIFDFSTSAYDPETLKVNLTLQEQRMSVMLNKISNMTSIAHHDIEGVIVREWSDQWWRGDTDPDCSSGLQQEYVQSYCTNGFWGLNRQYNTFGTHCIESRKTLDIFAKHFPNRTTNNEYFGVRSCVILVPELFTSTFAIYYMYGPIAILFVMAMSMWYVWRGARKREKRIIKEYLSRHVRSKSKPDAKSLPMNKLTSLSSEDSLLKNDFLQDDDVNRTAPLNVPGCRYSFVLKSTKPPPTTKGGNGSNRILIELHLREHMRRQKINVDCLIEHERRALDTLVDLGLIVDLPTSQIIYNQAVKNVHDRVLEGYRCWLEKVHIRNRIVTDEYGEILLFRLVSSISEHTAHCPERSSLIFHDIVTHNSNNKTYVIDLDFLQKGLTTGHLSLQNGNINFDDINDCGILNERDLRKTWHESLGPAVLFDYLRDYNCIYFINAWVFGTASLVGWAWEDTVKDFFYPFVEAESTTFLGVEFSLFFYIWLWQQRTFPFSRLIGFIISAAMFVLVRFVISNFESNIQFFALIGYSFFRIIFCMLPYDWIKNCCSRGTAVLYPTQMKGREKNRSVAKQITVKKKKMTIESIVFWILTMLTSWVVEVYMIVELSSGLTVDVICIENEITRCIKGEPLTASNVCIGCCLSVYIAKTLTLVTCLSITPLVFYFWVAIFGYYKGQGRKIANVFAAETCVVDLTANGRERKALEGVFGYWDKSAKHFWRAIIEDLHNRDLLSEIDKNALSRPGKKYIFSSINEEAKERLSFFLRTVLSLYKAKRRNDVKNEIIKTKLKQLGKTASEATNLIRARTESIDQARKVRRKDRKFEGAKYVLKENLEAPQPTYDLEDGLLSIVSGAEIFPIGEEEEEDPILAELRMEGAEQVSERKTWVPFVSDCWEIKRDQEEEVFEYTLDEQKGAPSTEALKPKDLNIEEHNDWFLRCIPRLSHVITCYSENIMLSREYLQRKNGQLTNLERLIGLSSYQQEWANMEERFKKKEAMDEERNLLIEFLRAVPSRRPFSGNQKALILEIRYWASYRAQTIARTIRGALSYHMSLKQRISRYVYSDNHEPCDLELHSFTELIVAHQTYGAYPKAGKKKSAIDGWIDRREDIESIIINNSEFPIYLVYDYSTPPNRAARDFKGKSDSFDYYWKLKCEKYWEKDEKELKDYWEKRSEEYNATGANLNASVPAFKNATCIKQMVNGKLTLTTVMPRMNGLRLGKKYKTQGKAANQVNALRAISGHVIQVSDANMDGWIGESFKLPYITRQFIDGEVSKKRLGDRKNAIYRIIGFREYIFTGPLGSVAASMASSEFVFGTLFQRVLTDPLDVRMHYGHPDFFDAFWVLNRGTLSKASPNINLSEDVFSGYNVALRHEKIHHSDLLEWQKGRETVFTAASGFLTKISAGSVAIQRSRDMKNMQLGLTFIKKMSLYHGGLGSFVLHLWIDLSIYLYMTYFLVAAYCSITLDDIQAVSSSLGSEWIWAIGMVSSLGYIAEMTLEYGWGAGIVRVMKVLPGTALFYLHQNKCMSNALQDSIRTGEAAYVDTGRPNAFDHYSTRTMYRVYAKSHYYPALNKFLTYYLYERFVGETGGVLPMMLNTAVLTSWIFGPVIFCPQISDAEILVQDVGEVFSFVFSTRDKLDDKSPQESLDKFWRLKATKFHSPDILFTRIVYLFVLAIPCIFLWTFSFSAFVDYACMYTFAWLAHMMLTLIFWFSNYSSVLQVFWGIFPVLSLFPIQSLSPNDETFTLEALMGALMFIWVLRIIHWLILIILTMMLRCCPAPHRKKKYNKIIGNLFFLMLEYHVHMYSAVLVCAAQSVACFGVMLLWWIYNWGFRFYRFTVVQSASASLGHKHARVKIL